LTAKLLCANPNATVIQEGKAAPRIIEYARQADVDLIAMTTHIHKRLLRLISPSIADVVLSQSAKPVLLVDAGK
jgi:nucleotide-binding universal stress UspA family protein